MSVKRVTISLMALILAVTLTPSASAECAWVLWAIPFAPAYEFESTDGAPNGTKHTLETAFVLAPYVRGAYPTHGECARAIPAGESDGGRLGGRPPDLV